MLEMNALAPDKQPGGWSAKGQAADKMGGENGKGGCGIILRSYFLSTSFVSLACRGRKMAAAPHVAVGTLSTKRNHIRQRHGFPPGVPPGSLPGGTLRVTLGSPLPLHITWRSCSAVPSPPLPSPHPLHITGAAILCSLRLSVRTPLGLSWTLPKYLWA